MNALEIAREVCQYGATLAVEDGQLIVRGSGAPLLEPLRRALREHKAEIMVALGVPPDRTAGRPWRRWRVERAADGGYRGPLISGASMLLDRRAG